MGSARHIDKLSTVNNDGSVGKAKANIDYKPKSLLIVSSNDQ